MLSFGLSTLNGGKLPRSFDRVPFTVKIKACCLDFCASRIFVWECFSLGMRHLLLC